VGGGECALEDMVMNPRTELWKGKRVFVTGHTGFKGGWLSLWLHMLGAKVYGYAIDPPTDPSFFDACQLSSIFESDVRADLSDLVRLRRAVDEAHPKILIHMAAQPLVRQSYNDPIETFMTNVMGTAHVLEACRGCRSLQSIVIITTDKVYENHEWSYPYSENDRLGGHDPYSASKAAAEIVVDSYRKSFFVGDGSLRIASVRAGNVIGGGDWAADRLVPDCLRSFADKKPVELRNPDSVRPWQHVLEPLSGYLLLAEKLCLMKEDEFPSSFNFGPDADGHVPVGYVADTLAQLWGDGAAVECRSSDEQPHEAGLLKLDISLARARLGWQPRWSVSDAFEHTVAWHRAWLAGDDMREVSMRQIDAYMAGDSCCRKLI
jgi:CDP-glucose 4,6-dehydratase